nr:AAA family ATPase [Halococcus salifodinae]
MNKYDDLFDDTAPDDSVFTDKGALDPLSEPDEIVAREPQERELATLLNGVHEGYLPTTVSIYGPPGTGKTLTTRRLCTEFAARTDQLAAEYVNLKECRSLFSAANEIHFELTGEKKGAYEGLDGVFEGIWEALAAYPEWTVLILDEIDQIRQDSNYDPNEFFYRLLRGEGKLKRDIQLSAWLLSNELIDVDLRVDSRVQSAMSDEAVFFPPYNQAKLQAIVEPRASSGPSVRGPFPRGLPATASVRPPHDGVTLAKRSPCFARPAKRPTTRGSHRSPKTASTATSRRPTENRPSRSS